MNLTISSLDAAIIVVYLLLTVLLGCWIGRGQKTLSDYLLGGRDLPWWAILGSIVATETSTATFLSIPGLSFGDRPGDLRFLQLALGLIVGRGLVVLLLLPLYFRGDLFTAYEVLERRFGGATKRLASLLFLLARNAGDGLRLFLAAVVLDKIIGLSLPACVIVIGMATIVYTFLGGMRSVVWNDCIQLVIYVSGAVAAGAVIVSRLPGGWDQVVGFALEHDKLRMFDFRFDLTDRFTFWCGLLGGIFLAMGTHGTDQLMVQRYLSARSQRDAARALLVSGVAVFVQFSLFLLLGIGLACFYDVFPPASPFERGDQVFATFIVSELPTGLVGLTVAAVFAAAMSTLSSSLNSSASSAINDLYLPLAGPVSPETSVRLTRVLTVLFGLVQMAVAIVSRSFADAVVTDVLSIAGFTFGLLLGVYFLGVLTRRVSQPAAFAGLAVGTVTMLLVRWYTPLAGEWYALAGSTITFTSGLLASLVLPAHKA